MPFFYWKEWHLCQGAEEMDLFWAGSPWALWLVCTSEASQSILSSLWGWGPAADKQPHGSTWTLRNKNCPLAWLDLCFGSCSHISGNSGDKNSTLTALPTAGLAGEGLQSLGALKRKAQSQTPEPRQPCSYLAKQGITPEHLSQVFIFQLILHVQKCWEVRSWCSEKEITTHQNVVIRLVCGFLLSIV